MIGLKKRPKRQNSAFVIALATALILALSVAAITAIWLNVREMDRQREEEHRQLSASIAETSSQFMRAGQHVYFYQLLQLLIKISFVDYLAVHVDGYTKLETNKKAPLDEAWIENHKTQSGIDWHEGGNRQYYVNQSLSSGENQASVLTIVFSKSEYKQPIRIIRGATAFILLLLGVVLFAMYTLQQTLRRLEYARQNKADTIYRITHDARQDLTVVQGKLTSVLRGQGRRRRQADVKKDLKTAHESTIALDRFLHNLNDQQRMEKGEVELLPAKTDLGRIIQTVVSGFEENLALRKMRLELSLPAEPLRVWADPQIVKRIIMNLIHNAMKYSESSKTIKIKVEAQPENLAVYIRDQGRGIAKKDWEKVFQAYYQIDPDSAGMGLGLATSRQLARLMGGELIILESVPGQGTTFRVTLPAYREQRIESGG